MPDRIIREAALTSETLANLSAQAERLFWRLTVVADDSGRFDANPMIVKAKCFPSLIDKIKTADVAKWLNELVGCVQFYTVDGRAYGAFRNWAKYQRVYGNKPKFPQPPADCGEVPHVPALILSSSSKSIDDTTSRAATPAPQAPVVDLTKRKKTAVPLPEDFKFTPALREWALGKGCREPFAEFERFCTKAKAKGYTYIDWPQAYQNWVLNELKWSRERAHV